MPFGRHGRVDGEGAANESGRAAGSRAEGNAQANTAAKVADADDSPGRLEGSVTKLEMFRPTAKDVLTAPAKVTGSFKMAKTPPVIEWGLLPGQWSGGYLWTNWGDSLFASDGNFYCSLGDHQKLHGNCYVYQVNPTTKEMKLVVDTRQVLDLPPEHYAPSKIHSTIMEHDGWIYFMGYRGSGHQTGQTAEYHYKGDPLFRYNLSSGKTEVLPPVDPKGCAATSKIHKPTQRIYGLSNGGDIRQFGNVFFVYDLKTNKNVFFGGPQPNAARALIVAADGRAWYSSGPANVEAHNKPVPADYKGPRFAARPGTLARYDPKTNQVTLTDLKVPGTGEFATLRAASEVNSQGVAYCISWAGLMFTFDTKTEKITEIGKAFEAGAAYTAVCKLSPDERFLYYVPGSHGGGDVAGCPVIQMDTKTGQRKVLAFVFPYMMQQKNYFTGGSFGVDISADGSTLGIIFNGRKQDQPLVSASGFNTFDQCSVMLVRISESER